MNNLLQEILKLPDSELVDVTELTKPEWELTRKLYYKPLGGTDREKIEIKLMGGVEKSSGLKSLLLGLGLCDEHGDLICKNGDARQLMAKDGKVLHRLADRALSINGFGKAAEEETAKNSEAAPSGASGSN